MVVHNGDHDHSHGHDHDHSHEKRHHRDSNLHAAYMHVLADALTSVEWLAFSDGVVSANATAQGAYLTGTAGNDVIIGDFGHDTLLGGNGNDLIFGDDGNDKIGRASCRERVSSPV